MIKKSFLFLLLKKYPLFLLIFAKIYYNYVMKIKEGEITNGKGNTEQNGGNRNC